VQSVRLHQACVFFRFVFALAWGIGGLGLLSSARGGQPFSPSSPLWYLCAYSASLTGLVLTAVYEGRGGIRRLLDRLIPWRSGPHWYLVVLIGYPLVGLLGGLLARLSGESGGPVPGWGRFYGLFLVSLATDPGPVGEEFGWRGFALPRLLARWSPLKATVILGLIWSAIHIPAFFIPTLPQSRISFPLFVLGTISICIFDTWIYLRTGANLLLAILVHGMANFCASNMGVPFPFFAAAEVIAASIVIVTGGLKQAAPARLTGAQC